MRSGKRNLYLAVTLAFAAQLAYGQAGGLPAEISARQANDTELQNNINAEAAARAAGDTQLQSNINAEAAARSAGDANLQTQIDQLRNSSGGGGTKTVDCNAGQTVSDALASGAEIIIVRGTCTESVKVKRDNVMLQADAAGGTLRGPDVDVDTIEILSSGVTIDGLTITGGRNGVTALGAANLSLKNCRVQSTGRNGVSYVNGSSGTVDGCSVQSNARDGVAVDAAQATIINSTITGNARNGVLIVNGGSSRVGLTNRLTAGGNTITQNGANGVSIGSGGSASIAVNTITDNGTDASQPGRSGIGIQQGTASMSGNTISRNAAVGVVLSLGSRGVLGDPAFGLTTGNTVSQNGGAVSQGGVLAFLGSSLVIRDALIEQNNGPGLTFSTRSQGQIFSSTIRNNLDVLTSGGFVSSGDGIRLALGSALLPATPGSTVTGNAGVGLQCTDLESSAVNTAPPFLTLTGNLRGDIPNCSGF